MVIQCPACQTRFRLADEKIGPHGVQVRCSKCAHTFPVKRQDAADAAAASPGGFQSPPVQADPSDVTKSFPPRPSAPATQLETSQPGTASPFAPPPGAMPPAGNPFAPPPKMPAPTPTSAPPGWPPADAGPPGWPSAAPAPAPSWPSGNGGNGAPPAGLGPSGLPAGIPDPFAEIADGNPPPGVSTAGFPSGVDLPGDPFAAITGNAPPPDPMTGMDQPSPELDESVRAALLGGSKNDLSGESPASDSGMQLTNEIAPPSAPAPTQQRNVDAPWSQGGTAKERVALAVEEKRKKERKKKGREVLSIKVDAPREPRAAYRMLMALFFGGAAVGAFASLTDGTLDPARLDRGRLSLLTGQPPPSAPGVEGITLSGLDGGFVDTEPGRPRLFVAKGVASNYSEGMKAKLQVKGWLRDAEGKPLAESSELWCGNTFRDDQLKDFRSAKELTNAYTDVGDSNSNLKIAPGGHVTCTVVFFDAPQPATVSDFALEIVAAQSVSG